MKKKKLKRRHMCEILFTLWGGKQGQTLKL